MLDAAVLRAWADEAVHVLDVHRAELDALNVFPVADSDTGTNLWLTLREGRAALVAALGGATLDVARGFARGALVGARGNSGVIVSQYLGELLREVRDTVLDGPVLARALRAATDAAYAAVARPVEGTVLTVARAVSEGARAADGDVGAVLAAGLRAGYEALRRTPDQLAALHVRRVHDAGGWGLLLVLGALADALGVQASYDVSLDVLPPGPVDHEPHEGCGEAGGAFEVMYVVSKAAGVAPVVGDGPADLAAQLRAALAEIGDSVAVVGGDGLWQAHVHTDTPLDAVASAAAVGVTATQVRVRHIERQTGVHGVHAPRLGLVTVTGAVGLTADLARAGAVVVLVPPGQVSGPELDRAVDDTGADVVLVLAADGLVAPGAVRAQVRESLSEVQVVVGAATLASLTGRDHDAEHLAAAVLAAVDGVRTAEAHVGPQGEDRDVLSAAVRLLTDETTLLTVLVPDEAPDGLADRLAGAVGDRTEVVVLPTGVPGRRVALGAEAGPA